MRMLPDSGRSAEEEGDLMIVLMQVSPHSLLHEAYRCWRQLSAEVVLQLLT